MELPFSIDQFLGVFAAYNLIFWPIAAALWLASLVSVAAAWRNPSTRSRALTFVLGILWLWNAGAYHALLFTRINPAAWLFAALFAVQGLLFIRAGTRNRLEYFASAGPTRGLGIGLACYALVYPLLNIALGHSYPATPTFGVPCPTAILTIGALVSARRVESLALAVIPALWGFVGGSAAFVLEVPADYVLLAAGILLTAFTVAVRVADSARR